MPESEPQPFQQGASDGDVERLLREAETLTQEVVRATGATVRDADALLAGELVDPPDPLAAVETAASNVMSLEDLLGELDPGAARAAAANRQASETVPSRRGTPQGASRPPDSPRTGGTRETTNRVELATPRTGPRVEHMPTPEAEAAGVRSDAPDGEGTLGEESPQRDSADPDSPVNGGVQTARMPLHLRALVGLKTGVGVLKWGLLLVLRDLPVGLLAGFDLPFRRTPRPIKNVIGIIGAITLAMGVLAWALPGLLHPAPEPPIGTQAAK